jgi:hypothetical protein
MNSNEFRDTELGKHLARSIAINLYEDEMSLPEVKKEVDNIQFSNYRQIPNDSKEGVNIESDIVVDVTIEDKLKGTARVHFYISEHRLGVQKKKCFKVRWAGKNSWITILNER